MARYVLNEDSTGSRFIHFIYKTVIDGRIKTLQSKIAADPELQGIIKDIEGIHQRLTSHLAKHKAEMKDSGYYSGE
jgi:hypothetical protein